MNFKSSLRLYTGDERKPCDNKLDHTPVVGGAWAKPPGVLLQAEMEKVFRASLRPTQDHTIERPWHRPSDRVPGVPDGWATL